MARKKAANETSKPVKVSLSLSALLTWRLTTLAGRLGRDRSSFAEELLDAGLSRYQFDKDLRKLAPPEYRETSAVVGLVTAVDLAERLAGQGG